MLVQSITNSQNNYKIRFLKFKGGSSQAIAPVGSIVSDTIAKSSEKPVFTAIRDIANYLNANADRIENGKIFNYPITKEGDSLLMAFFHMDPLKEEQNEYESILFKMSKMPEINYDQKDSVNLTALEWVVMSESLDELALMKGKKVSYDPMLFNAYKRIKNPEFRKALLESELYIPPVCETKEEQKIIVSSIINKKHDGISDSLVENIVKTLCNNENKISNETIVIFKKIIHLSRIQDVETLPEVLKLLKDDNGNVSSERAADFLAVYEQKDSTIQNAMKSVCRKYNLEYNGKTVEKTEYRAKFDEYVSIQREFASLVRKDYLTNSDKARLHEIISNYKDVLNELWWQHDESWWNEQLARTGSFSGQQMTAYEQQIVDEFNEAFMGTDAASMARIAALIESHRDILEKYCPDRLRALGIYPGDIVSSDRLLRDMVRSTFPGRNTINVRNSYSRQSNNNSTQQLLDLIGILSKL